MAATKSKPSKKPASAAPARADAIAENPSPQAQYKAHLGSRLLDKSSFIFGAIAGILIFIFIWFTFFAAQQVAIPEPGAQQPPAPRSPVELVASSRLPSVFQVVIRNNDTGRMNITGIKIGGKFYNITATLEPGEMRAFSLGAPPCSEGAQYDCQVTVSYQGSSGSGESSHEATGSGSGEVPGNSTNGTSSGNNATGGGSGQQQGETPRPLAITTTNLAVAVQDQKYSFALEATGGTGRYTWSAFDLPRGLSMAPNGMISGSALDLGEYAPHITVYDGVSSSSLDMPLYVILQRG